MSAFRWVLFAAVLDATACDTPNRPGKCEPRTSGIVDLSYPYDNKTVYWDQSDHFVLNVTIVSSDPETRYQVDTIETATHGGTHLDAPLHFDENGWDVAEIPVERLALVPVARVDITQRCALNASCQLTVRDLLQWEAKHGALPDRCVLMVHTGWDKFIDNITAYFGLDAQGARHFPSVSVEAAQFLARDRRLSGMGIDTASLDVVDPFPVHRINALHSVYNLENLRTLGRVPASGAYATVAPMKIAGASGAPVRVFVYLPDAHCNGRAR
ncbi:hypothetical protein V5799_026237 [Amblyomma americanum]|uniref:Uncharacterized protein n=1 Tax=Amblyomma americanum TaxID=6943 RepID=A0AAQ4DJ58_AMBAM